MVSGTILLSSPDTGCSALRSSTLPGETSLTRPTGNGISCSAAQITKTDRLTRANSRPALVSGSCAQPILEGLDMKHLDMPAEIAHPLGLADIAARERGQSAIQQF